MTRSIWMGVCASLAIACGQRPAPRSAPTSADTCASRSAPGVDVATAQALEQASNALEYENIWKQRHPGAASGTVNGADVQETLRAHAGELQQCFVGTQAGAGGSARVVVRFLLDATGQVANASIASTAASSPEFGCCVVTRLAQWHFPTPEGGFVTVEYPFTLRTTD